MSEANPERTATPAPPSDEISLRELYLVLRRGAGWIIGATALVGLTIFFILSTRPDQYRSEAVVVYEAPPVSVRGGDVFAASLVTVFPYEAYEALAFDRLRVAEVLAAVPEIDWSVDQLISRASLERRSAANAAVLAVVHAVRATSPEVAAKVAQVWADLTAAAVRETIRGRIADSRAISERVAELRFALEVSEDALSRFAAGDDAQQLRARESALIQRLQSLDGRRSEVLVELSVLAAERTARNAEVATLAKERGTLTATGEAAFAGASSAEVQALAAARSAAADAARRSAADALAEFDAANPLGLWEAELAYTWTSIAEARTSLASMTGELAEVRAQLVAVTHALERIPQVAALQTALIDASVMADALAGAGDLGDRVAVTEAQNPVRVEAELEFERLQLDVARLEAALVDLDRRIPELERRESDLRARLAVGTAERTALDGEAGVSATLARSMALTARAAEGPPSDTRLAPSPWLAEAEAALRTADRRIAALGAEIDAVATALVSATGELAQVRADRAALELQRTRLQRDYELAESLYSDIAALTPSLEVVEVLAPLGVRILSAAYVPVQAEASRALLVSLLAAVVAAFGMVVLLLLREAVSAQPGGAVATAPARPRVEAPAD